MLKVVYCADGIPISDFKAHETVDNIIETYLRDKHSRSVYIGTTTTVVPIYNYEYRTSSELCLLIFSLRVLEEKISIHEIEFYFEDEKLKFDLYDGIEIPENNKQMGLYSDVCVKALQLGYQNLVKDKKS